MVGLENCQVTEFKLRYLSFSLSVQVQQRLGTSAAAAAVDVALLFLVAASDGCEGTAPPTAKPLNKPSALLYMEQLF